MKPTVPGVRPLVSALYGRSSVGCCLHIVLDDGNVTDDNVLYCLRVAREECHADCERLAETLLQMSKTQRRRLGGR